MIETDAPYLTPVPHRGKRNEPSFVQFTLKTIAHTLNQDFSSLAQITTDNAKRCFGIQD